MLCDFFERVAKYYVLMMRNLLLVTGLLFVGIGCATLSPAGKKVKIVDPVELSAVKAKCEYIGTVSGTGDADDANTGRSLAKIELKNHAAEMRANVVVSKLQPEGVPGAILRGWQVRGQGYFCVPEVLATLTDAESM